MSTSTALIAFCLSAETFPRHLAACLSSLDFPSKSVTCSLHLTPHRVFLLSNTVKTGRSNDEEIAAGSRGLPNVVRWSGTANNDLCRQEPVWDHLLDQHAESCNPNKKKMNSLCSQFFAFAVHLDSELSSAALWRSHIVPYINNTVSRVFTSPRLSSFFFSQSKSTGMKTIHFTAKAWRGIKHSSLLHFSLLASLPWWKKNPSIISISSWF